MSKLVFAPTTRQNITLIEPNNNAVVLLEKKVFDFNAVMYYGFILVSGAWKKITTPYTIVSGAWKVVAEMDIVISNIWKTGVE